MKHRTEGYTKIWDNGSVSYLDSSDGLTSTVYTIHKQKFNSDF